MTERDKVTVDEVIGLIHTDEPTNSVEEVRKLRGRDGMTEKRFTADEGYYGPKCAFYDNGKEILQEEVCDMLNNLDNRYSRTKRKYNRLQKDFNKLWLICRDAGLTEDEILKELER